MNDSTSTRRWVPIQHLLDAIDDRREHIELPPAPVPVYPATDEECFALNRPRSCASAMREAGLPGLSRPSYSRRKKTACTSCGTPLDGCEISADTPDYTTDANGNHTGLCCEDCQHPGERD